MTAAAPGKLGKQAILARYLRGIEGDDDLRRAVWFAAGLAFAATDERVLGASGAVVSDVLIPLLGIDARFFYDLCVSAGEVGEAISQVWSARADDGEEPVSLEDLSRAFEELAATGNFQAKREILRALFLRCRTPREAAYVAKIIFGDMRTGVQEGALQSAIAEAFDKTLPDIRRCQLLIGDLGEVAVLAKRDRLSGARFTLFHPIQFMLATAQETSEIAARTMAGRTFYAEDKLDGIRAQVHKSGNRIAIYTRTMARTDESFPDVVAEIQKLPGEFLLDGEIVPFDESVVLPFAHIQRRLGRKSLTPAILRENPAVFIAFDILYLDGRLLIDEPLHRRRLALRGLHTRITDVTEVKTAAEIDAVFDASRGRRNEGIVLKDPDSAYSPGRRGQAWLKIKTHLPTIDCVVTAAEYGNGKRRNSLSDYTFGVWDGPHLVNIGKAYIGVTDEEIAQLTELFLSISMGRFGRVFLVPPKVVLEIACDSIQRSARHPSGFALRFPRVKRIRWDKRPEDADTLARVREIFASATNFAHGGQAIAEETPAPEPTLFDGLG
jgi:DNA ligase 1